MVPSIQMLVAQILTISLLPMNKQSIEHPDTKEELKMQLDYEKLTRFGTEEIMRRMIKKDT